MINQCQDPTEAANVIAQQVNSRTLSLCPSVPLSLCLRQLVITRSLDSGAAVRLRGQRHGHHRPVGSVGETSELQHRLQHEQELGL